MFFFFFSEICFNIHVAFTFNGYFKSKLFLITLQEMQSEMEKHMAHLQQLKDFDETLALEREEKARQEQERRRMEVYIFF